MGWTEATPVIVPGHVAEGAYGDLLGGRKTMEQYVDEAPVRAGPVWDDRPFFFARQKPWGLPRSMMIAFVQVLLPLVAHLRGRCSARAGPRAPGAAPIARRSRTSRASASGSSWWSWRSCRA